MRLVKCFATGNRAETEDREAVEVARRSVVDDGYGGARARRSYSLLGRKTVRPMGQEDGGGAALFMWPNYLGVTASRGRGRGGLDGEEGEA